MLRTQGLFERIAKHVPYEELDWANHYGEPGYTDPERGILFANWNKVPQPVQDVLERNGFALEWSDEWIIDHESDKAYRCSPDCYSWVPSYVMTEDCEIIGKDDLDDHIDSYIEIYLNDSNRAATFDNFDPAQYGFEKYNGTFESGVHPGQTDDPKKVAEKIESMHPNHDYLFTIDEQSQFYTKWCAWIRPQDYDQQESAA